MLPEKELQSKSVSSYVLYRLPSDFILDNDQILPIIRPDRKKKKKSSSIPWWIKLFAWPQNHGVFEQKTSIYKKLNSRGSSLLRIVTEW